MRRGIFGFDIWFYGIVALLLAVCQQPLVLGGLMLFVMLVEKDEWLNRQVMQALLMCLGVMAVSLLVHKLSAVFAIVPFFGWMLRWGVDQVVDLLLLLGMALFAIRAADRMHKGLDSDIPFGCRFCKPSVLSSVPPGEGGPLPAFFISGVPTAFVRIPLPPRGILFSTEYWKGSGKLWR